MNEQIMLYEEPERQEDVEWRMWAESAIPEGPVTITRSELARVYGSDRAGRKFIEQARRAGTVIVNQQDGRGYYRPSDDDVDAVLHQLRSTHSRAMALLKQEKAQREWLRERGVNV